MDAVFAAALLLPFAAAIPIDNGVVGYPAVTCGPHSIRVDLETEKAFTGRIFVKGESERKDCVRSFTTQYGESPAAPYGQAQTANVGIDLKFGECNMRRQRTLYPRGVEYTFTMVASFHPLFITKVDRAYRVRCFYMEAEKTVSADLDVSMLTTGQLNEQFPMPQCYYHLKRSYDGPYVRYAKVGDKVVHSWECGKVAGYIYGMLVKNCFVDDGQGNKVELVDEKGCPVDIHLLPSLTYSDDLITAHVESHVFKYADKPQLFFQCSIQLCVKNDGGCGGITPPICGGPPSSHGEVDGPAQIHPPSPYGPPPQPDFPFPPPRQAYPSGAGSGYPQPGAGAGYQGPFGPYQDDPLEPTANRTAKSKRATGVPAASNLLEADLIAPSLIVLPFDELEAEAEERELSTLVGGVGSGSWRSGSVGRRSASVVEGGVCLSDSGFGILVALFASLFLFATTLAILLLKNHFLPKGALPR